MWNFFFLITIFAPQENKKTFVVINQKGIDPLSLNALVNEAVMALRRSKRLILGCGGTAMNSVEELEESDQVRICLKFRL